METAYCLGTVEKELGKLDLDDLPSDIAEIETSEGDKTLIISGWWVHVPELRVNVHQGVICKSEEGMEGLPEFYVTIIKERNETLWFSYEETGTITVLYDWLEGQYSEQALEGMPCYIRRSNPEGGSVKLP